MAEDLGRNWFRRPRDASGNRVFASTQYGVDNNSVVGYVSEDRAAYGANREANNFGLHIEHMGRAKQPRSQWLDDFGVPMLDRSARLTADLCNRYAIPPKFLTAADLSAGRIRGITTHVECTKAWGGTHTDPGAGFPIGSYIDEVSLWMTSPTRLPVLVKGDRDGKNSLGEGDGRADKGQGVVSRLQRRLVARGFELPEWGVDGDFGDETEAAVVAANTAAEFEPWAVATRDLWVWLDKQPAPPPAPEPVQPSNDELMTQARMHLLKADQLLAKVRT